MKRAAILIGALSLLLLPTAAFAEVHVQVSNNEGSSEVHVSAESSGTSTVCQNGNCTTTGGENTSTVCVNGSCTTTNDDVHYHSEDGSTKVEINNSDDTVAPTSIQKKVSSTPELSVTPDPDFEKKREKVEAKVQEVNNQIKQRAKGNDGAISTFIQYELASLHQFVSNLFH